MYHFYVPPFVPPRHLMYHQNKKIKIIIKNEDFCEIF